jgi:hypothetical protein
MPLSESHEYDKGARGPGPGEPNPGAAASPFACTLDISTDNAVALRSSANQDRPEGRISSAFLSDFRIT